jgi:N-acetylglucosamine-6-sulfatase
MVLVLLATAGCVPAVDNRPNMVVILVDDMRWDEFGKAGHAYLQTPNIDRLATEGVMFVNAFATTPLCSPSRASFLTGQYPHTHGIVDNTARDEQSHRLRTFPAVLDSAGYATAFVGKWHMGNDDSPRPGFDYWVSMQGQGEALNPTLNVNGVRTPTSGYVTDVLTDYSLRFIRESGTEPFLLYLAHKALHPNVHQRNDGSTADIGEGGFVPAERHKGMYAEEEFVRRPSSGIAPADKPALMRTLGDLPPPGPETATPERTIRERAEMLMGVEESLGRIMALLEEIGKLDNTIIVFTSDHGFWYGEHGLNEERRLAYEEGIRIPLLVRYPGTAKAGIEPDQMVMSIDLAPTLLDLAGVQAYRGLEGRSFVVLLAGERPEWRNSVFVEYYSDTVFPRIDRMGYKAIRTDRYKYIRYEDLQGMDELYDLEADPYELKNLIKEPSAADLLHDMQARLDSALAGGTGK